ncbi:stress-activated map kinase-interacting protein 1 [Culicoides brevitarsis]|uniref:stress-activated map kinase-interacting protein 1 n=1 Tax=Culicoides brevitarsis TaxID=469753 RepID=UPI00307B4CDB
MATYNNKHWLLSHIKNSFISTDDTGICEAVMLSDDLLGSYLQQQLQKDERDSPVKNGQGLAEEFLQYPGLDENEEDEVEQSQSFEIQLGNISFQRQRSNTAQKLERMEYDRRRASKIKRVKYNDNVSIDLETDCDLFQRKEVPKNLKLTSVLSDQLEKHSKLPQNKFQEYAKYDGTAQRDIKTFKIFLTMLGEPLSNYPLEISVISNASIEEFIGLICYKCSIQNPDVPLMSVRNYGLNMAEEDGDVDPDFPPLESTEPCSKFHFGYLALVERRDSNGGDSPSVRLDFPSLSMTSEAQSKADVTLNDVQKSSNEHLENIRKMDYHNMMIEAPHYRMYHVYKINKARMKIEIKLGVSGEKMEIDPAQQKPNKFWPKFKSVSHSMDSVAWCEKLEEKSSKTIFRIYYSLAFGLQHIQQESSSPLQGSATFKYYDFEAETSTANEIIEKVNNILEICASTSRREFIAMKERQSKGLPFKKHKF